MSNLSSLIKLKPSEIARALLQVRGKPLNMKDYLPMELIYDIAPPQLVLRASRQIGKSLGLGATIIAQSVIRPFFTTMFISPLSGQTSRFSSAYLDPFLASPVLKKHFMDTSSKKNVFEKSLNNGSRIYLSYAETEADSGRVRGASCDQLLLDEIQDISQDALPVLYETLSASEFGFKRLAGTSKTLNNTLEVEYKKSSQCEWVCKCEHCGKYTIPIDFETCLKISENPLGPGCVYCGKVLNMSTGRWAAARPEVKNYIGMHLPQLIFPVRTRTGTVEKPGKWEEMRGKIFGLNGSKGYSMQKVANEVFGLPSGEGGRILSIKECMDCCNTSKTAWDTGFPRDSRNIVCTVLGVDWSVSGSTKSYTIISILGYDYNGKCYLLYSQKLDGIDVLLQVKRAEQLYHQFECSFIGSDRGVGVLQGQLFKQHLGDQKVAMVNYVASKTQLRWDKQGLFYAADRTMNIDTVILKMKLGKGRFETPAWELTNPFWQDALNVYEEESQSGRRLYRHDQDLCDDWLHSIVFANVAYMVIKGDFLYTDDTPSHSDSMFDIDNLIT